VSIGLVRETKGYGDKTWHSYTCYIHDAGPFPGCTTIINKKDKPQLAAWFKKQGALAAIRNLEALPELLETIGEKAVVDAMAAASDKLRDDKGDAGTRVHSVIEAIFKRQPFEVDEDIAASIAGFEKWVHDRKPEVKASEFMVVSETHRYAATGDAALVVDLREWGLPHEKALVLVDAKTGYLADTISYQFAAIRWADHAGVPGDPKPYAIPQATHFAALAVRPDGTELVPFDVTPHEEFRAFLSCRNLYEWDRTRSKQVMRRAA
jgi:hypothetical protein